MPNFSETSSLAQTKPARFMDKFLQDRNFNLFLLVGVLSGVASGISNTVFNNFLSDTYRLSADARGIVEFPRELPGVFIMVILGLLAFLGDIRISVIGQIGAAIGMIGLGLFSPTFAGMMVWMMVLSLGTHMVMPLTPAIGMSLSSKENYGARLGRYSAYTLFGTLIAYAFVWAGFRYLGLTYTTTFIIAGGFYAVSALIIGKIPSDKPESTKFRLIFKRQYSLFYALSVVNGARKQIFMTFAPWVLIQVFHLDVSIFAILGALVAGVSILTRRIVGNAIDQRGERFVLTIGAVVLIFVCFGYAFAEDIFSTGIAVVLIAACYVLDNSMTAVDMARSTYLKKIILSPEDLTPTLSAGISIDHIVSMTVPFLGGLLWTAVGYKYVFIVAACIALINLLLSQKIRLGEETPNNT